MSQDAFLRYNTRVIKIKPQTLKGFRDFLPKEVKKRQWLINILISVFESYGFEPLETPSLEYAEVLRGKYGEEEKLIYEFETRGKDKVALRYDQTVPLSRVITQYQNELVFPFKRYQIQNVWRGENPQKGRYREFIQCDADIIGSSSPIADAEILRLVLDVYKTLRLNITIKINDRENFKNMDKKYVSAIDKLEKIGESAVLSEMVDKGMASEGAKKALSSLQKKPQTAKIKEILSVLKKIGADMGRIIYEPTLARGLNYYTEMIFETVAQNSSGSLCSGGRFDKLIGKFLPAGRQGSGVNVPAVGFGLGFDRTLEILEEKNLIPQLKSSSKFLVTTFNKDSKDKSLEVYKKLRDESINCEIFLDETAGLEKQLKYADKKGISYVLIIGPKEIKEDKATIKNLKTGDQKTVSVEELIKQFNN
ncbi:MAG: histidine--tRNA ligase [Candidatus Levybacteria bacterium RIFCSPLOWO2_01_FULL_38_21]|nr:MAG: histidine--tRNA ligase [Candidatus Levybacteria bacterium RIFCSPLOWO2_01_FULL_38_21]